RMETRGAWQAPADYGSVTEELTAARSVVAAGERCGLGVLDLIGAEVSALAGRLEVAGVPVGAAAPVALAAADEARWDRLTRTHARVVAAGDSRRGAPPSEARWSGDSPTKASPGRLAQWLIPALAERRAPSAERCLHITDVSSGLTTLVVVGPR